MSALSLHIRVH